MRLNKLIPIDCDIIVIAFVGPLPDAVQVVSARGQVDSEIEVPRIE